ncbi:tRNA:m(4)X modification enzyme TRM13 homolog [Periplaneta americana]|uniref:tRNA:m(4)X modification enzyme TRM13 homolog n=1 Tax=Periplaneta americana TaxID=6978 RepID=UPI0037E78C48
MNRKQCYIKCTDEDWCSDTELIPKIHCQFYVQRKERFCKMTVKEGEKYCGQHMVVDCTSNGDTSIDSNKEAESQHPVRIECPYDRKHSCYAKKLQKHLAVCNARPKEQPLYIVPGINCGDESTSQECRKLADLEPTELSHLIQKIESVYQKFVPSFEREILSHAVLSEEINNPTYGPNKLKHLLQNASLLGHAEKVGLMQKDTAYIEFGAGRGLLSFYVAQTMQEDDSSVLFLVDRASQRHKFDNKLKDTSRHTERIRADIADLCLENIPSLLAYKKVVALGKHLCGAATDLALRCVVGREDGKGGRKLPVTGILLAFCCHHRCEWSSYTGKDFLQVHGFTVEDFYVMRGIASWATCWPTRSDEESDHHCDDDQRPIRSTLSEEEKKTIGRKSKAILNYGRQKYLESYGYKCRIVEYVTEETSPENVCLLATT